MPNHIKNRITLSGPQEAIDRMLESASTFHPSEKNLAYDDSVICKNKETGAIGWLNEGTNIFRQRGVSDIVGLPAGFEFDYTKPWTRFPDFNKIKPMPEALNISLHSGIETMVKKTLDTPVSDNDFLGRLQMHSRANAKSPLTLSDSEWDLFMQALNNVKKYGHAYWYDWAIENWGTKWNSYQCGKLTDNVYEFDTAWSSVCGLIEMLSQQNPQVTIEYEWSDEDTGSNCGEAVFLNGLIDKKVFENSSIEAYEKAFKLRPEYSQNYEMVDGKYQYKEDKE